MNDQMNVHSTNHYAFTTGAKSYLVAPRVYAFGFPNPEQVKNIHKERSCLLPCALCCPCLACVLPPCRPLPVL